MEAVLILTEAKKHLVTIANQTYQKGLTPGKSGNISIKIKNTSRSSDVILITPSSVALRDVNLNNVIVTDLNGKQLEGEGIPSSELQMHLAIYKRREDIGAIVHTHSPYATGFSFTDKKIPWLEGFGPIKEPYLEEIEYATPGSSELVELASSGLKREDVLILKNHGVVAVGPNLDEAVLLAEFTEKSAKTGFIIDHLKDK